MRKAIIFTALLALGLSTPAVPKPLLNKQPYVAVKHTKKDVKCLADNIYHEARGESYLGKLAVGQVTINRLKSGKFAKSICGIVYQQNQFSWTKKRTTVQEPELWKKSYQVADQMLNGATLVNFTALYFHSKKITPVWRHRKHSIAVIGNHVFYSV